MTSRSTPESPFTGSRPTSAPSPTHRSSRRRACEACRQRKVKCDGRATCQQCAHLHLHCTYSTALLTRKGIQRRSIISLHVARHSSRPRPLEPRASPVIAPSPPDGASAGQWPEQQQHDAPHFLSLIEDYVSSIYDFYPIVDEAEVLACVSRMDHDPEAAAFMYALAAATVSWTSGTVTDQPVQQAWVEKLAQTAVGLRVPSLDRSRPSIISIMTPVFLHLALAGLQRRDAAWFYLREAVTLVQLLAAQDLETHSGCKMIASPRGQRLYWMLFVQERFMGVRLARPPVLAPLFSFPESDPAIPFELHRGFTLLVSMFRLLDARFFMYWLPEPGAPTDDASTVMCWIESAQASLDALKIHEALPELRESQHADLVVTKMWLQVLFWQVAVRICPLSSSTRNVCLSLQFPLRLTDGLAWTIRNLSRKEIQAHGNSMVYKLFELTVAIADVVCVIGRSEGDDEEGGHRMKNDLYDLARFVLRMDRLEEIQRTILRRRIDEVKELG